MVSDRCPSHYWCRQYFLQLAKLSKELRVTFNHMFAVVHRFKGDHDAEGKVSKRGAVNAFQRSKEPCGSARECFVLCRKLFTIEGRTVGFNEINDRYYYWAVYSQDEYEETILGDNERFVVYADMDCTDDGKALRSTNLVGDMLGVDLKKGP